MGLNNTLNSEGLPKINANNEGGSLARISHNVDSGATSMLEFENTP